MIFTFFDNNEIKNIYLRRKIDYFLIFPLNEDIFNPVILLGLCSLLVMLFDVSFISLRMKCNLQKINNQAERRPH